MHLVAVGERLVAETPCPALVASAAATLPESSPPLRSTPMGTSLRRCESTASSNVARNQGTGASGMAWMPARMALAATARLHQRTVRARPSRQSR